MGPGIPGSGSSYTEFRNVAPFDQIRLSGSGDVNVVVGQPYSVSVTSDDNLVGLVETYVKNGELVIKQRKRLRPLSGMQIDIALPELTSAQVSGAGDIVVDAMQGDRLEMGVSGAGSLTARGWVRDVDVSITGAGDANLSELYAENASVQIAGAGDAEVFATHSLDAQVTGAGDILCYGNPGRVSQQVAGAGEIVTADMPLNEGSTRLSDQNAAGTNTRR